MSTVKAEEEMAKSLIAKGREVSSSGDIAGAINLYDAALALDASNHIAHKLRGDCFFRLGQHSEAIDDYNRTLHLQPKNVAALYNRAVAKKSVGKLDEALVDLGDVLSLNKDDFNACMTRGDILIEFGRLEEAQADYARATVIDPSSFAAVYRHGKAALFQVRGMDDRRAIFEYVYKAGAWGKSGDPSDLYFSGSGTRVPAHSNTYLQAVGSFLQQFEPRLKAVDIGCGDFVIGSQVRPLCANYVACDVVAGLIEYNKEKYAHIDVDFRALDAVNDPLPDGDIVFLREVLQHLSNSDISKIISKVSRNYKYAIITECLPSVEGFTPNLDKVTSDKIRPNVNGSGVILTEAPFSLTCRHERRLCVSPAERTSLVTTLYSF